MTPSHSAVPGVGWRKLKTPLPAVGSIDGTRFFGIFVDGAGRGGMNDPIQDGFRGPDGGNGCTDDCFYHHGLC